MIKDRGNKKWVSMMLPEHVQLIRKYAADDYKEKKPQLDEQKLEEFNIIIMESLRYTLPIKVTTWENGYFKEHLGIVAKVSPLIKGIFIQNDEELVRIWIEDITEVVRK